MTEFEKQFREIKSFLDFEDYSLLTKRVIDLTLDTEDISFYQKTNELLDWLDQNENNIELKKQRFALLLEELYQQLKNKPVPEKQILVTAENLKKHMEMQVFRLGQYIWNSVRAKF